MEPGRREETAGRPLGLLLAVAWVWCGKGVECHMGGRVAGGLVWGLDWKDHHNPRRQVLSVTSQRVAR